MLSNISSFGPTLSRIPFRIIFAWIALVALGYYVLSPPANHPFATYSYHTQSALLSSHAKAYMPQAIVFIAMGKVASQDMVEDAINACRLLGHWTEHIYILTDRKSCFDDVTQHFPLTEVISVPSKNSIMEIKTMKAEIFHYLPRQVERVLYLDVDILVTRNIGFFLTDLTHILFYHHNEQLKHLSASQEDGRQVSKLRKSNHDTEHSVSSNSSQVKSLSKTSSSHNNQPSPTLAPTSSLLSASVPPLKIDFAAFLDAKGHYVGFCSGCEKWHTGVMYLTRKSAEEPNSCLKAWAKVLGSGMYDTDQESLDFTENNGSCPHAVSIPSRHLLFAKDYIAMMFTSGQTFIHLTAVNHKEDQDYFYREIVVPRVRNSLHPPLRPYNPNGVKVCT